MKRKDLSITLAAIAIAFLMGIGSIVPAAVNAEAADHVKPSAGAIADEVRHELLMLPYYGVFDNLEYEVQDHGTVILSGQVTRPTLRSDAENVVRRLPGVGEVVNRIEVLPLSRFDDRIRIALYRALFSSTQLDRYALGAIPSIHIIVKNGNVTLEGVVATQTDKNVAWIVANGVPGTFQITNNLTIERKD